MMSDDHGWIDNLCRAYNVTPADAERLIADFHDIVGGESATRWYVREQARLVREFTGDEAPTAIELSILIQLARLADVDGVVVATKAELAQAVGIDVKTIGHGIAWAVWRRSIKQANDERILLLGWPRSSPREKARG